MYVALFNKLSFLLKDIFDEAFWRSAGSVFYSFAPRYHRDFEAVLKAV